MNFNKRTIGIWGLGVVGRAAVRYLHAQGAQLQVVDNRTLSPEEQTFLAHYNIPWFNNEKLTNFLAYNDFILPSPGIDLRPHSAYQSKWLSELDIFRAAYTNPIIAITGSVGKTSVTHLLSAILSTHYRVATGGNIGTAMFDLLTASSDIAILEVSSFQLDLCKTFAPDIAIWTNFYPNHLDRHGSEEEYFAAKSKILLRQHEGQKALMPLDVFKALNQLEPFAPWCADAHSFVKLRANGLNIFSLTKPSDTEVSKLDPACTLFCIENNYIVMHSKNHEQQLIALSDLPDTSFTENWLIICSALTLINTLMTCKSAAIENPVRPAEPAVARQAKAVRSCAPRLDERRGEPVKIVRSGAPGFERWLTTLKNSPTLTVPEHRLEKVATINGITFYNDSKSTTPQSTLAAIAQLQGQALHLFIGGISKGIDRKPFIENLKGNVQRVYCFGKESEELYTLCTHAGISAQRSTTLEEAFSQYMVQSMPGQQVLFSPAGASFDLFKDYKERGNRFKELVATLTIQP